MNGFLDFSAGSLLCIRAMRSPWKGFGSENTRTGKTFPVTFKAKRKQWRAVLVAGYRLCSEAEKGKLFGLVFPAGAKPGGFVVYFRWIKGNLEALSGLLQENVYFLQSLLSLLEDHHTFGKDKAQNLCSERGPASRCQSQHPQQESREQPPKSRRRYFARAGYTGVTSNGWGPDDAPVAECLGGGEVKVGDSCIGLGCVENWGTQVGGGGVVHVSEGVGVFSL